MMTKKTIACTVLNCLCLVGLLMAPVSIVAAEDDKTKDGWISLFDGQTLKAWKYSEGKDAFTVENGTIVAHGLRSHLFYDGPVQDHNFRNFELKADVMTTTGANSGIYFHTEFQKSGYPNKGYEAQINSTHLDPKRTGSLYGVKDKDQVVLNPFKDADKVLSRDGKWFQYHIIVKGKKITLKVDGKTVVEYEEPASGQSAKGRPGRRLSSGTFALQAHPPVPGQKGTVYFKNITVKPLPD